MSKYVEQRETKVLGCLLHGWSNGTIASHLGIPEHLVKKDIATLMQRYNASGRVSLVVNVWKSGQQYLGTR